jgi:hypothetical protein
VKGVNGPRKVINVKHLDYILRGVASFCLGVVSHSDDKLPKTLCPVEQQSHPAHLTSKSLALAVKLKVAVRDAYRASSIPQQKRAAFRRGACDPLPAKSRLNILAHYLFVEEGELPPLQRPVHYCMRFGFVSGTR